MAKLMLKNVRLSFPDLWRARAFSGGGGAGADSNSVPKFGATFLIPKDDKATVAAVKKAIQETAVAKWGAGKVPKSMKPCIHDGDDVDYDGYEGTAYLKTSSKGRPICLDRARAAVSESDGVLYAGCWVNASISFWAQDNQFGKRVNAELLGVQFVRDDEAFSGGEKADVDDFETLDEDMVEDVDDDMLD